MRRPF